MTTPQQQIIDKCQAVFAVAAQKYNLDFSRVAIHFDLRGRAAGQACRRGNQYYMRFNRDMLTREAFDHVLNDTVPHEIAHIVCFMNPMLGANHNSGWARVCRALGGTGTRCHKEDVVYGKGHTYEYVTDRGHKVRVGDKYHAMVQRGQTLTYKRGLGKLTKECQYSVVGYAGRTLTTAKTVVPVQPTAPAPVQAVAPVQRAAVPATFASGASKASISRSIMLSGHNDGKSYEEIIAAMMAACGYDRQLARATYKANAAKVGCPVQ